jgi:hypothetical protein
LKPDIFNSIKFNYIFEITCGIGHLTVAKWLLQVNPTFNVSANNEEAFRLACKNGKLEIAKWLLQVNPNINISSNNEEAFRWACGNGYLMVAQWLLQVNPTINVYAKNHFAFRYSIIYGRRNNNYEVVKWLNKMCPNQYIVIIKNNKVIKSTLPSIVEKKWRERKLILASHLKGKKSELLYELPIELVRYISEFV